MIDAAWLESLADRVWPVLLFLVLIQLLADLSDDAGLFDVAADRTARLARGRTVVLFVLFCALAVVTTWLLSIDTTAVLLAPIGLTLARRLDVDALPFAFASVWLASTASLLLPVSNLTNLLALEKLDLGAAAFVRETWRPQLAVLVVVMAVLLLRHRRALQGRFELPTRDGTDPDDPRVDRVLVLVAAVAVVALAPAVLLGVEPWAAAAVSTAALVAGFVVRRPAAVTPRRLLALVPWSVLVLASTLFLVLGAVGTWIEPWLAGVLGSGGSARELTALAATTSVLANVVNNLPAYLLMEPVAGGGDRLLVVLVSVDVAPLLLTWGALANLLWLRSCRRRGLEVGAWQFFREGLLVVPIAVAVGVLAVALG